MHKGQRENQKTTQALIDLWCVHYSSWLLRAAQLNCKRTLQCAKNINTYTLKNKGHLLASIVPQRTFPKPSTLFLGAYNSWEELSDLLLAFSLTYTHLLV